MPLPPTNPKMNWPPESGSLRPKAVITTKTPARLSRRGQLPLLKRVNKDKLYEYLQSLTDDAPPSLTSAQKEMPAGGTNLIIARKAMQDLIERQIESMLARERFTRPKALWMEAKNDAESNSDSDSASTTSSSTSSTSSASSLDSDDSTSLFSPRSPPTDEELNREEALALAATLHKATHCRKHNLLDSEHTVKTPMKFGTLRKFVRSVKEQVAWRGEVRLQMGKRKGEPMWTRNRVIQRSLLID